MSLGHSGQHLHLLLGHSGPRQPCQLRGGTAHGAGKSHQSFTQCKGRSGISSNMIGVREFGRARFATCFVTVRAHVQGSRRTRWGSVNYVLQVLLRFGVLSSHVLRDGGWVLLGDQAPQGDSGSIALLRRSRSLY
jgi:hypothetical protein